MHNDAQPTQRLIKDDSDFVLLAKACMEESDHMHADLNDNGQLAIYPCGTEFIWVFDLAQLEAFLERRNVAIANGSQYDFLHGILQNIRSVDAQKTVPVQEPEVANVPVQKRGDAQYTDGQLSREGFMQALIGAIVGQQPDEAIPERKWAVDIDYDLDVNDGGNMSFEVDDLSEVMERIRYLPVKEGSTFTINVEFL